MPDAARRWMAERVIPSLPARAARYARRSFLAVNHTPEAAFFDNFAAVPLARQRELFAGRLRAGATEQRAYSASRAWLDRPSSGSLLDRVLYADIKTYLVELLMKQDQMSMAASIESRVPFLDHRLVEFVATMPAEWKLSGLTTKRVLREAAKDLLPSSILNRPKMGFPVPFAIWSRGPWHGVIRDVLLDRRARERGLFDTASVTRLLDDHAAGRAEGGDVLWSLLNLELWYRTWIDGDGVQHLSAPASDTASAAASRREPVGSLAGTL